MNTCLLTGSPSAERVIPQPGSPYPHARRNRWRRAYLGLVTREQASVDTEQLMRTCLWPLLRKQAAAAPDAQFFTCGRESLTYMQTLDLTARVAAGLRGLGLERGDRMAVFADNGIDALVSWFGANAAGIVDVPINLEARGESLRYLLADAQPRAVLGSAARLAEIATLTTELPEIAIVLDGTGDGKDAALTGYRRVVSFGALRETDAEFADIDGLERSTDDLATIMYTSGTTGPSKGVMLPHGYYAGFSRVMVDHFRLGSDAVVYVAQPLFHIDARWMVVSVLAGHASIVLGGKFSARRFWNDVRHCGATHFLYIGTMMWIMFKQEETREDAAHRPLTAIGSSTAWEIQEAFERRFNVTLYEAFGMTEGATMIVNDPSGRRHGSVGRASRVVDVAVVDAHDDVLPAGREGELVLRPRYPNVMMQGYWNRPEATLERWRNMWFHTGDLVRMDSDGYVYYLGRVKDSIRRRGENVSAWEVEQALMLHAEVLEAAAIGVPSDVGEDEVAAVCVIKPGSSVTHAELHAFVARDLPRFAVPRYIDFVESLPKTPSERIAKAEVRDRGLSETAWDATI
jgi:crotonobetaine/carnitine-CoA ligase